MKAAIPAALGVAALYVRIALIAFFGSVAEKGIGVWDPVAGTLTLQVDDMTSLFIGVAGIVVTFLWGRIAKRAGLAT